MGFSERHIEQADAAAFRIDRDVVYADGGTRPHVGDVVYADGGTQPLVRDLVVPVSEGCPLVVLAVGENGILLVRDREGRTYRAPSEWFMPRAGSMRES